MGALCLGAPVAATAAPAQIEGVPVTTCPATVTQTVVNGFIYVAVDPKGNVCLGNPGGGGGGGGAVTGAAGSFVDGWSVTSGSTTDAACSADNGTCGELALLKRENQRLTTLNTTLGSPFQAGGSIGNSAFGITGALPAGTNVIGHVIADTGSTTAVTAASGSIASGSIAAGAVVDIGTGVSPAANTVNARLATLNTTLGSPFQAGAALGAGSNTIGKVDVLGAGGATLDAPIGAGAAPANGIAVLCQRNTSSPTPTNAQTVIAQCGPDGAFRVILEGQVSTGKTGVNANAVFDYAIGSESVPVPHADEPFIYNGSTEDAAVSSGAQAASGGSTGVASVEEAGASFSEITTATSTTVKGSAGVLQKVVINTCVASATIKIYNNTSASGTPLTITCPSTVGNPVTLSYDAYFGTGIFVVTSGTTDATVVYR